MMPVDVEKWINDSKEEFVPPVCNKCMFSDQLMVFFVGGPNSRKDYHMQEGEEFFYQKSGDMVLKFIERGVPRDITIKAGEFLLLPSRVEHSPQRFSNTIGFVVERTRDNTEFDCVRYFVGSTTERLFERWFHLKDIVRDLPPLIKAFLSSNENMTGKPGPKSFLVNAPYEPVAINLPKPVNLKSFIEEHKDKLRDGEPIQIFGAPSYSTDVYLYGEGKHTMGSSDEETLLWTLEDSQAVMEMTPKDHRLCAMSMMCCPPHTKKEGKANGREAVSTQWNLHLYNDENLCRTINLGETGYMLL